MLAQLKNGIDGLWKGEMCTMTIAKKICKCEPLFTQSEY